MIVREIVRCWGVSAVGSPCARRWLTRLVKKQAYEQLTDVGTGFFKLDCQKNPHNKVTCYCRKYLCSNIKLTGRHEQYFPGDKRRSIGLKEHSSLSSRIRKRLKYVWIMIFYTLRNYKTRVKLVFAGLFKFYCVHEKLPSPQKGWCFPEELLQDCFKFHIAHIIKCSAYHHNCTEHCDVML